MSQSSAGRELSTAPFSSYSQHFGLSGVWRTWKRSHEVSEHPQDKHNLPPPPWTGHCPPSCVSPRRHKPLSPGPASSEHSACWGRWREGPARSSSAPSPSARAAAGPQQPGTWPAGSPTPPASAAALPWPGWPSPTCNLKHQPLVGRGQAPGRPEISPLHPCAPVASSIP